MDWSTILSEEIKRSENFEKDSSDCLGLFRIENLFIEGEKALVERVYSLEFLWVFFQNGIDLYQYLCYI